MQKRTNSKCHAFRRGSPVPDFCFNGHALCRNTSQANIEAANTYLQVSMTKYAYSSCVLMWWYSVFGLDLLNCMTFFCNMKCSSRIRCFQSMDGQITIIPKTRSISWEDFPLQSQPFGWPTGGLVTIICPDSFSKSQCFPAWKISSSFGGPDLTIHTRWAPTQLYVR